MSFVQARRVFTALGRTKPSRVITALSRTKPNRVITALSRTKPNRVITAHGRAYPSRQLGPITIHMPYGIPEQIHFHLHLHLHMRRPPPKYQTMPLRIREPEPRSRPTRRLGYDNRMQWPRLAPWSKIMEIIKAMESLSPEGKLKFGYIFAELLGLPKPRKRKTKDTTGDKFAVKLLNFDEDKKYEVLRSVVNVKFTEKVIYSLDELSVGPSLDVLESVPSVIKQGVSKEEAKDIIGQIEAAGGVAVMEPLE